jgi:(R)-2-hydroxyacyl-CoA dehydratese activating ATPase
MRCAGLDIGSRTVKLAVLEHGKLVFSRKAAASYDPLETANILIKDVGYDTLTATGYGRHLIQGHLDCPVISEIKAFAVGSWYLHPGCRSILDIGGQDTKVIALDDKGNMNKFEMNDKCAAGTGRFLEVMAAALGFSLEEFALAALSAPQFVKINSMCTVFAESEVISLTAQGKPRNDIALGIHKAIVSRCIALLKRIAPAGEIFFAGGVAFNPCVKSLLENAMGQAVFVSPDPQIVGAIGAALSMQLAGTMA